MRIRTFLIEPPPAANTADTDHADPAVDGPGVALPHDQQDPVDAAAVPGLLVYAVRTDLPPERHTLMATSNSPPPPASARPPRPRYGRSHRSPRWPNNAPAAAGTPAQAPTPTERPAPTGSRRHPARPRARPPPGNVALPHRANRRRRARAARLRDLTHRGRGTDYEASAPITRPLAM